MKRIAAAALCGIALVFPVSASAQQVLNGSISGLTLPMTLNGVQVTHLDTGSFTFSLLDNSGQHSIHVMGPLASLGYTGAGVNFGTAGPNGIDVPAQGTFVFDDVPLTNGQYRWFCDRHSDMMTGSVTVGNYLSVDVVGLGSVSSFPVDFLCRSSCGLGVPDGAAPITLAATPQPGYRFDHWENGPCSGDGDCTVTVAGLVQVSAVFKKLPVPPPTEETTPGTIKRVRASVTRGKRLVAVTLDLTASAATTAQLRVGGRMIAAASGNLAAGSRTLKIRVPKSAKAGPATVRVTFKRTGSAKTFSATRSIRLPKL